MMDKVLKGKKITLKSFKRLREMIFFSYKKVWWDEVVVSFSGNILILGNEFNILEY